MRPEATPLAAGLGAAAEFPTKRNRLNRFQSSRAVNLCGALILVRHHDRDGGLRVVNFERATSGEEFYIARSENKGEGRFLATAKTAQGVYCKAFLGGERPLTSRSGGRLYCSVRRKNCMSARGDFGRVHFTFSFARFRRADHRFLRAPTAKSNLGAGIVNSVNCAALGERAC